MINDVVISNPERLEQLKKAFLEAGIKTLHVLADFDRTLTKAFINNESVPSMLSILRDGNYLTKDYAPKAYELFNKYHPIEIDPKIALGERKKAMEEWWTKHFDLLIKSGLSKKDIEKVLDSGKVSFREGFSEFMDILHRNDIPLVIMSSSGLGADPIIMAINNTGKLNDNVFVISNSYVWDENGNAVSVNEPIIHALNKDETLIQDFPAYKAVKDRKNVLLLGDNLEDVKMIEGFDCDNIIKVGFLNENVEESLKSYKQNYDVVITNDGSMNFINLLLNEYGVRD